MALQLRKKGDSRLKSYILLGISAGILLHCPVRAESIDFQQTAGFLNSGMTGAKKYARRSADFSMDKHGDVVMRCLDMSITVANNSFDESPNLREMMQRVHVQLTPKHDGINVKVGFAF